MAEAETWVFTPCVVRLLHNLVVSLTTQPSTVGHLATIETGKQQWTHPTPGVIEEHAPLSKLPLVRVMFVVLLSLSPSFFGTVYRCDHRNPTKV